MVVPLRCFLVLIWIPRGCGILKSPCSPFVFIRDLCFLVTSRRVCPGEIDVGTRNACFNESHLPEPSPPLTK